MGRKFEGKVVIITGSSSGIGREALLLFAGEGALVVMHGQSEERIIKVEKALKDMNVSSDKYHVVRGSLQDDATVERIVTETVNKFGKIDVLVNNAGAPNKLGCDNQWSVENYNYVFDVCLKSAVRLTLLAMPYLDKTKGNVVNIGSVSSMRATSEYAYYSMAKAAFDQFTRNAAYVFGSKGIRVNSVVPGATLTNILSNFGVSEDVGHQCFASAHHSVLNRPGKPEEVARAILFLASSDSSFTTGALMAVDGGAMTAPIDNLMN